MCSMVLTLTVYFGAWTVAETVWVPSLSQYERPTWRASSAIHTMVDSNWSDTSGGLSAAAITSPREQSISLSKHSVSDWPARPSSISPSIVTMRDMVEV